MKYYIYISDTKVDMLYSHIPKTLLKKIASCLLILLLTRNAKLKGLTSVFGMRTGMSCLARF